MCIRDRRERERTADTLPTHSILPLSPLKLLYIGVLIRRDGGSRPGYQHHSHAQQPRDPHRAAISKASMATSISSDETGDVRPEP